MNIIRHRKHIATINTLEELDEFVKSSNCYERPRHVITCKHIDYTSILEIEQIAEITLMRKVRAMFAAKKETNSVRGPGFWLIRGHSEAEAKRISSEIQSGCSPSSIRYKGYNDLTTEEKKQKISKHQSKLGKIGGRVIAENPHLLNTRLEFYINKGYSKEEAEQALKERQSTFSMDKLIEKYGEEEAQKIMDTRNEKWLNTIDDNIGLEEFNKLKNIWQYDSEKKSLAHRKRSQTNKENGHWIADEMLEEWLLYKQVVRLLTNRNAHLVKNIEKRSSFWHLDHKYSIKEGFINRVDPEIISSHHNLEILNKYDNCSKKDNCSITLEELVLRINQ